MRELSGVSGLDTLMGGGLPRGRLTVVSGEAGEGKTLLSLQFLVSGLRDLGAPGLFVSFGERADEIMGIASGFGWPMSVVEAGLDNDSSSAILLLDASLASDTSHSGDFDLSGLLAIMTAIVRKTGVKRVVFDSIEALLDLLPDVRARRREMVRLREWLRAQDLTAIVTSRALGGHREQGRYDFMEDLTSCLIALRRESCRSSQRMIEVVKFKGAAHRRLAYPLIMSEEGLSVRDTYDSTVDQASSGIPHLGTFLGNASFQA